MLTEQERREIEQKLEAYPDKRAGAIDALMLVQRRRGWVSDESVRDIARLLAMTEAEVDGVATFYNLIFRKPVGRHVVLICDSISCWIMGYERVRAELKARYDMEVGRTTGDGRFTVLPIACLGHCERAPAMMVDRDTHGNVTPEKLDTILEKYQ